MFFAVSIVLLGTLSTAQTNLPETNQAYKEAYFEFLNKEIEIPGKLSDYHSAKQAIPKAQQNLKTMANKKADLLVGQKNLNNKLDRSKFEQKTLKEKLSNFEKSALLELDKVDEGVDTVVQLQTRHKKLSKIKANFLASIAIEKRKVARVKRTPEYQFYINEIDVQGKRVARLSQDIRDIESEIAILNREILRLVALTSTYQRRVGTASTELPELKKKMQAASDRLDQARANGTEREIQVAETAFHQAFANYRRVDVELKDSELGFIDASAKTERKRHLKDEKSTILTDSRSDRITAEQKVIQTQADFTAYKKIELDAFQIRLSQLSTENAKVVARIENIEVLISGIGSKRAELAKKQNETSDLEKDSAQLKTLIAQAEVQISNATAALQKANNDVSTAKSQHNQSVQSTKLAYQNAIEKQKLNQAEVEK